MVELVQVELHALLSAPAFCLSLLIMCCLFSWLIVFVIDLFGVWLTGTQLHGYLVRQEDIPLRTSPFKHILKLLARRRLGTRWAAYPLSRCRSLAPLSPWKSSEPFRMKSGGGAKPSSRCRTRPPLWYAAANSAAVLATSSASPRPPGGGPEEPRATRALEARGRRV